MVWYGVVWCGVMWCDVVWCVALEVLLLERRGGEGRGESGVAPITGGDASSVCVVRHVVHTNDPHLVFHTSVARTRMRMSGPCVMLLLSVVGDVYGRVVYATERGW